VYSYERIIKFEVELKAQPVEQDLMRRFVMLANLGSSIVLKLYSSKVSGARKKVNNDNREF